LKYTYKPPFFFVSCFKYKYEDKKNCLVADKRLRLSTTYPHWPTKCPGILSWAICLLLSLFLAGTVTAQRVPATTPWIADSVLSNLTVQVMASDAQGYLWVGTPHGLRRYDGYQAVALTRLLTAHQAVPPQEYVRAMACDAAGRIWFGGPEGLYCLVPAAGTLRRIPLPIGVADGGAAVTALWLDPHTQRLWVGYCKSRVLVLDTDHPDALSQPLPPALSDLAIQFAPGPDGGAWLTIDNGQLHRFDAQGRHQAMYSRPGTHLLPVPETNPQLVISSRALFELDPQTNTLRERQRWLPVSASEEQDFYPVLDAQGRPVQWVTSQRRVLLQWEGPGKPPVVRQEPIVFNDTEPSTQYTLFQDTQGLWWCFNPTIRSCYKGGTAVPMRPLPTGLVHPPSVRGLTRLPDGQLLVTSYSGVFTQPAGQPFAPLRALALTRAGRAWPAVLYQVYVSAAGRVLFADEAATFGELNVHTGALTYYAAAPDLAATKTHLRGRTLYQSRDGTVWGGTQSGLYQLDEVKRQVRCYGNPAGCGFLRERSVRSISEDAAGVLWLATDKGLYAFNPATGALVHYGTKEAAPTQHLSADDLLCVYAQPGGSIWVGTATSGVLQVVAGRGQVSQLSTEQGLPSPTVVTLLPGEAGELWAGTYAGLARYRPATGQFNSYGLAEGMTNPELNKQAAYRASDGTLFFGGLGGVFRVDKEAAQTSPDYSPRLLLTAHVNGPYPPRFLLSSPSTAPAVHLDEHVQEGGFDLAITDYRTPELHRFFYQVRASEAPADSGLTWQSTGRHLRLHGLVPGTYELLVSGQTSTGRRTPVQHLNIVVALPWWRQPLVLLGAVVLLLGAGVGGQQLRIRRMQQEKCLRNRIAADLHDEVGALLTRVTLRAELLQDADTTNAPTDNIQALLHDSQAALAMMRDVVWSIDAGADTVGALYDRLYDYSDATAKAAGIHATLTIHNLSNTMPLPGQVRQQLYLIAKEAVTNAVRHALYATRLELSLWRENNMLYLLIWNDGLVVTQPLRQRQGMGLRNMQRRAHTLGGQCYSQPESAGGWSVRVSVPF
jgi:signal transduction histidine kinase/streptogramin lyase